MSDANANFDWTQFLTRWNECVLAQEKATSGAAVEWLGFPPATEQQIAAAEARLQIALPPSYRAFLKTSNGWARATQFVERIRGVDEVEWFCKFHRDWIAAYAQPGAESGTSDEEYFGYGRIAEHFRSAHLKAAMQISDVGDSAVYLLNPQVISRDGEWEAWFLADWVPGVRRYRSFLEMMQAEFHQFAGLEWKQPEGIEGGLPDEYTGAPGTAKRRMRRRSKPREAKVLGKPLSSWSTDELLAMLAREDYDIIHDEVIDGLLKLGDRKALEPLLAYGRAHGRLWSMSALRALAPELAPEVVAEPALDVLRRRDSGSFHTAAHALAELKDIRAVPLLVAALLDVRPESSHLSEYVGSVVIDFGIPGLEALVDLLKHKDPVVRRRAANGLMYSNDARAGNAIKPLLDDPDAAVREAVKIALEVLPGLRQR